MPELPKPSSDAGGSVFPADPAKAADEQSLFWTPEVLPSVIPLIRARGEPVADGVSINFAGLRDADMRQVPQGWHVILRLRGVEHRVWLSERPRAGTRYAALLPLDDTFDV